jgi:hypothetical protein
MKDVLFFFDIVGCVFDFELFVILLFNPKIQFGFVTQEHLMQCHLLGILALLINLPSFNGHLLLLLKQLQGLHKIAGGRCADIDFPGFILAFGGVAEAEGFPEDLVVGDASSFGLLHFLGQAVSDFEHLLRILYIVLVGSVIDHLLDHYSRNECLVVMGCLGFK